VLRRNAVAIVAGLLLAIVPAGVAAAVTSNAGLHSWSEVTGSAGLTHGDPVRVGWTGYTPTASATPAATPAATSGTTIAAAGLAGIVATLALMLVLVVVSFSAFFLLGVPAMLGLVAAGAVWGTQFGFGSSAPLQVWLVGAGGIALLALALNTGAALPIYWSLVFGSGRRLDRLREAWSGYWSLYRGIVIPACALFGVVVFRLLSGG
jgi:hypothetical protein